MARSPYEFKTHKQLVAEGYVVDFKAHTSRPIKNYHYDFFNLFDIIAWKLDEPLRWISVKGRAGVPSAHRRALEAFKMPLGNVKELWVYKKDRTIRREIIP